jgi:hypothetical protein
VKSSYSFLAQVQKQTIRFAEKSGFGKSSKKTRKLQKAADLLEKTL